MENLYKKIVYLLVLMLSPFWVVWGQQEDEDIAHKIKMYPQGHIYTIDTIMVSGSKAVSDKLIIAFSTLKVGDKFLYPGSDQISRPIKELYNKNIFTSVDIVATRIKNDSISLLIQVKDRPRLTGYRVEGLSKKQKKEIEPKLGIIVGRPVTQHMIDIAVAKIKDYYKEKGYNLTEVKTSIKTNTSGEGREEVLVIFQVNKGRKVRIYDLNIWGNNEVSPYTLRKVMKGTRTKTRFTLFPKKQLSSYGREDAISFKEYVRHFGFLSLSKTKRFIEPYFALNIFNPSKYDEKKYEEDKKKVIDYYNENGFRDAKIITDTIYSISDRLINVDIKVKEGNKYYFGDITWAGNSKYSDSVLSIVLGIGKGTPYNRSLLEKRLGLTPSAEGGGGGGDIMSLYMDDGHLFFRAEPIERRVYNDTIDFEIRILEGPPATVNNISITGNNITKEHVIRRSLRVLPGSLFSRADIIRSVRELANLGFLNQEAINPQPKPNIENGTVDILLGVEEKSNDQIEASVSYGGYVGVTGTLGLTLKNFSLKQLFHPEAKTSFIPRGDGQTVSIRTQLNGPQYQSYSFSFTEPWLGNRFRRTSLSFGINYSTYTPGGLLVAQNISVANPDANIQTFSATVSLGTQLRWPDDYFIFNYGIGYTRYQLKDYTLFSSAITDDNTVFNNGVSNSITLQLGLSRSSVNNPMFPTSGSTFGLTLDMTPPYSLFDRSIVTQTAQNRYSLIEYYKLGYNGEWYIPLSRPHGAEKNKQLVLKMQAKGGYLGRYNSDMPYTPFERFQVGDAGLTAQNSFLGYDVISQRGYYVYENSDPTINPQQSSASRFFTIYNKCLLELRYPITFSNSATIYATSYFEMANGWYRLEEYNPFRLRKSVGVGIRFFLPIFGLLGFDYAIGIDRLTNTSGSIFDAGKFSFILGFEPK